MITYCLVTHYNALYNYFIIFIALRKQTMSNFYMPFTRLDLLPLKMIEFRY